MTLYFGCHSAADCGRLQQQGVTKNGVYALFVSGHSVSVQCDFTTSGGGWIVRIVSPYVDVQRFKSQFIVQFK